MRILVTFISLSYTCSKIEEKYKKVFVSVRIFVCCLCFIQCNPLLIPTFLKPPAMLKPALSTSASAIVSIKWGLWNLYIGNHSQIRESGKSLQPVHLSVKRLIFKELHFFFCLDWGWLQPEYWYFRGFQLQSDVAEAEFEVIVSTRNKTFSSWDF